MQVREAEGNEATVCEVIARLPQIRFLSTALQIAARISEYGI